MADGTTAGRKRPRKEAAPTTPDPIEIAMEAEAGDASPDSPARTLLLKQGRLIDYQLASERMGLVLKSLTALAAVGAAVALAVFVWQASRAHGIVIEAFQAPPDIVARGLSGQVLASQIEDRLRRMQAQTFSARAEASYSNGWSNDVSVEIPQTGVSVSELQRFLRQQFGHETRVGGELFRAGSGLRISVRASGQPGDTFDAPERELDVLLQRAAEAVYGGTEPFRYAIYLESQGRAAESEAVLRKLAATGPIDERAWALSALARRESDPRRTIALGREAEQLNPKLAAGSFAMFRGYRALGDYEGYFAAGRRFLKLLEGPGHGGFDPKMLPERHNVASAVATVAGDFSRSRRESAALRNSNAPDQIRATGVINEAYAVSLMHEPTAAIRLIGGVSDADNFVRIGSSGEIFYNAAYTNEDYASAIRELDGLIAAMRAAPDPSWEGTIRNRLLPLKMQQLAYAGRLDEARAIAAQIPTDCYFCMSARAYLASASGDGHGADRWLEALISKAPNVAWAYMYLADTRLKRGELDGSIEAVRRGLKVGPHWADLHAIWGEALLRKGDAQGALPKFAEAYKYAPRWGKLHLEWGEALAKLDKVEEARAKWTAAATMDLSPADRTRLRARMAMVSGKLAS